MLKRRQDNWKLKTQTAKQVIDQSFNTQKKHYRFNKWGRILPSNWDFRMTAGSSTCKLSICAHGEKIKGQFSTTMSLDHHVCITAEFEMYYPHCNVNLWLLQTVKFHLQSFFTGVGLCDVGLNDGVVSDWPQVQFLIYNRNTCVKKKKCSHYAPKSPCETLRRVLLVRLMKACLKFTT